MHVTKDAWISHLGLTPHLEEGGYYAEQYRSAVRLADGRCAMDTIYYMLTNDSPIGRFHRNESDIVHFFHAGSPLRYTLIAPDGSIDRFVLGPDPHQGHVLQRVVPAGHWKATELDAGEYGLLSEAVTPAFSSRDRVIASSTDLLGVFPDLDPGLLRLARPYARR